MKRRCDVLTNDHSHSGRNKGEEKLKLHGDY